MIRLIAGIDLVESLGLIVDSAGIDVVESTGTDMIDSAGISGRIYWD